MTADERPIDPTPIHTADLPPTPIRDHNMPASAWIEAPDELVHLGDDIDQPLVTYKRRIGRWLLWRAGPASRSNARYLALDADDLDHRYSFRLFADGHGRGHRAQWDPPHPLPGLEGGSTGRTLIRTFPLSP